MKLPLRRTLVLKEFTAAAYLSAMYTVNKVEFEEKGFTVLDDIFSTHDIDSIIKLIETHEYGSEVFRRSTDLYAIRQVLKVIPQLQLIALKESFLNLIRTLFGVGYFPVKSIYFDKPGNSNWFVAYHQDLSISVDKKAEVNGFGPWTVKQNQFAVQPPLEVLQNNFTARIHLDDTDSTNGVLKVIPASHKKGIYRPETIDWNVETEEYCPVKRGGVMFMSPLLLHASGRTISSKQRRVLHIEFSKHQLPTPLQWSEKI